MKGSSIIAVVLAAAAAFLVGRVTAPTKEVAAPSPTAAAQKQADPAKPPPAKPTEDPNALYKVPVGNSPAMGPADAKVTIVEVTDFQCPFCKKANETMRQIAAAYPKDVRFVAKMNPLSFHQNAPGAAQAALAAFEQGKYWEMHHKLFENNEALTRESLDKYAQDLGLNMAKFKEFVDGKKGQPQIDADQKLAGSLGATGTPAFFINGHKLVGALPIDQFKTVIDEQIKKADELIGKGIKPAALYEELTKAGSTAAVMLPAAAGGEAAAPVIRSVDFAPFTAIKGSKGAKVKIVEWSDFQCPFCSRGAAMVDEIMKAYPKDVQFGFRNFPLDFHPRAMPAAKAAMAANKQGKFYEMHDKLFANQKDLSDANIETWAKEIGLDMAKFKKDMESPEITAQITEDKAAAGKAGVNGTPTFYINGRMFQGSFDQVKPIIDAELAKK